jgi:speckle-type POZ protein
MAAPLLQSSVGQVLRSASAIVSRPLSGSHVLRIDGYSHLKEAIHHGQGTESCDFNVGDHTWRLLCYPNGRTSKFKHHFAVSYTAGEPVVAQSQFSLLDQLGKPVLLRDAGTHKFLHGHYWGFHDFICRKELEESEHIKDDRFAILCNVSITTVRKCSDNWAFISPDL